MPGDGISETLEFGEISETARMSEGETRKDTQKQRITQLLLDELSSAVGRTA
jgi:hypothetical protein